MDEFVVAARRAGPTAHHARRPGRCRPGRPPRHWPPPGEDWDRGRVAASSRCSVAVRNASGSLGAPRAVEPAAALQPFDARTTTGSRSGHQWARRRDCYSATGRSPRPVAPGQQTGMRSDGVARHGFRLSVLRRIPRSPEGAHRRGSSPAPRCPLQQAPFVMKSAAPDDGHGVGGRSGSAPVLPCSSGSVQIVGDRGKRCASPRFTVPARRASCRSQSGSASGNPLSAVRIQKQLVAGPAGRGRPAGGHAKSGPGSPTGRRWSGTASGRPAAECRSVRRNPPPEASSKPSRPTTSTDARSLAAGHQRVHRRRKVASGFIRPPPRGAVSHAVSAATATTAASARTMPRQSSPSAARHGARCHGRHRTGAHVCAVGRFRGRAGRPATGVVAQPVVEIGHQPVGLRRTRHIAVGDVVESRCGVGELGRERWKHRARVVRELPRRSARNGVSARSSRCRAIAPKRSRMAAARSPRARVLFRRRRGARRRTAPWRRTTGGRCG